MPACGERSNRSPSTWRVRSLISLAKSDGVVLESHALRYLTDQHMKRAMVTLHAKPLEEDGLEHALTLARTLRELPFELNLWQAQNIWYDTLTKSNRFLLGLEDSVAEPGERRFWNWGASYRSRSSNWWWKKGRWAAAA
jgi:hypothetical protein